MATPPPIRSPQEKRANKVSARASNTDASPIARDPDARSGPAPRAAEELLKGSWSPAVRGIVSALVLFHLTAAIVAALVAAPPYSELWFNAASVFRPYVNAADLNHGYRFFAPDPGPSHLVRYHLEFADGSVRDGKFPDLEQQRPRLLYHRYFMLSEHLFGLYGAWQQILESRQGPAPLAERQEMNKVARDSEALYRAFAKSYADELLRRNGAKQVTLELIEHVIPRPQDVAAGRQRLDDPALYSVKDKLGPFGEGGEPEEVRP
jgi:hypothetical protein